MRLRSLVVAVVRIALAPAAVWGTACVKADPPPVAHRTGALGPCDGNPEGALCNDGNTCTINDTCRSGSCAGTVVPDGTDCTDEDVCTSADKCFAAACKGNPVPDGFPCDDRNECTLPDSCLGGRCRGGPPAVCDDGISCTLDVCVMGAGCVFSPVGECTGADGSTSSDTPYEKPGPMPSPDAKLDYSVDIPVDEHAPESEGGTLPADGPVEGGPASDALADVRDATAAAEPGPATDVPVETPDAKDGEGPDVFYSASGGACVCGAAQTPGAGGPTGAVLVGVVGLAWGLSARRRRRP